MEWPLLQGHLLCDLEPSLRWGYISGANDAQMLEATAYLDSQGYHLLSSMLPRPSAAVRNSEGHIPEIYQEAIAKSNVFVHFFSPTMQSTSFAYREFFCALRLQKTFRKPGLIYAVGKGHIALEGYDSVRVQRCADLAHLIGQHEFFGAGPTAAKDLW